MMRPKAIFYWLYQKGYDYNLFIHEENDYDDDDDDDESKDPAIVIKHQKYTTWLYVLLLTCKEDMTFSFFKSIFSNKLIVEL